MGLHFKNQAYVAAGITLLAIIVNLTDLFIPSYDQGEGYAEYIFLFMGASIIGVVSHTIKENTVRSVPIDQDRFTFTVSLSQLICGILISPIIVAVT